MVSKVDGGPDYLDAAPVSDGVAVRMSENVALVLTQLVGELIRFLETGELELENRGTDRWASHPTRCCATCSRRHDRHRIRCHAAFGTSDGISVWLCTDTDEQRDQLATTDPLLEQVRGIMAGAGFTLVELSGLRTSVQSQETVDREYEGSWFLALR